MPRLSADYISALFCFVPTPPTRGSGSGILQVPRHRLPHRRMCNRICEIVSSATDVAQSLRHECLRHTARVVCYLAFTTPPTVEDPVPLHESLP